MPLPLAGGFHGPCALGPGATAIGGAVREGIRGDVVVVVRFIHVVRGAIFGEGPFDLGSQGIHPGAGDRGEIESVHRTHLIAQCEVDRIETTVGGARLQIATHQHVHAVPLQNQAYPAQMLLAPEISDRKRHPDIGPGGDGPAQGRNDGLHLGQVVGTRRLTRLEAEGLGDHRALLGRLDRKVIHLKRPVIPQDDDRITGIDGLSHLTTPFSRLSRHPQITDGV